VSARAAVAAVLLCAAGLAGPAWSAAAQVPPVVPPPPDPGLRPTTTEAGTFPYRAEGQVGPAQLAGACAGRSSERAADLSAAPQAQARMRIKEAHEFATGRGQTVAVIDSGVNPHPRLADRLDDGGDYILGESGTADCEGHGTVVAGIIAAAPDPGTGFVGVAPDARILAIRQSSTFFEVELPDRTSGRTRSVNAGDTTSMARAIVSAVQTPGVSVINISEAACYSARQVGRATDRDLQAAVRYATERDVVVVAAAANEGDPARTRCRQNPDTGVGTIVSPAWFDADVLAVAATDPRTGAPASFSIRGPWVDVAAPGTGIVSLDPSGTGLTATLANTEGDRFDIIGTSFAAPYVSGVVALVRERFPDLTAQQVVDRIQQTAQHTAGPGGRDTTLGYGVIDPIAALTDVVPGAGGMPPEPTAPARLEDFRLPEQEDPVRLVVALVGAGGALGALGITVLTVSTVKRHRRGR